MRTYSRSASWLLLASALGYLGACSASEDLDAYEAGATTSAVIECGSYLQIPEEQIPPQAPCTKYAAPDATGSGDGSAQSPFTLSQALSSASGEIVCLRGGTYGSGGNTVFTSTATNLILRSAPDEHAVIDGGLDITGNQFLLFEVEIKNSQAGTRPRGVEVNAHSVALRNNLIHDTGTAGVYTSNASECVSLEGNLIYANGFGVTGRGVLGKAHGLRLVGNAIANNEAQAVDLGGSDVGLQHNAFFGRVRAYGGGLEVSASHNLFDGTTQFGYSTTASGSLTAGNNLFSTDETGYLWVGNFGSIDVSDNRIIDTDGLLLSYSEDQVIPSTNYWERNSYEYTGTNSSPVVESGVAWYSFGAWKAKTDPLDTSTVSTVIGGPRIGTLQVGLKRGQVSVASFHEEMSVSVDVASFGLDEGDRYEVWNAKNPCGDPPILGVVPASTSIDIPLTGWTEAEPTAGAAISSDQHAFVVTSGRAHDFCGTCDRYASPSAPLATPAHSPQGTFDDPWNLQDVLTAGATSVQPGDTVCLRDGEYKAGDAATAYGIYMATYEVTTAGQAGAPITFRPFPGEHASIRGGFFLRRPHLRFQDLEIYDVFERNHPSATYDGRPPAFSAIEEVGGPTIEDVKVINCRLHDRTQGAGLQTKTVDTEFYGNTVYNNGWDDSRPPTEEPKFKPRGHGHAFYLQSNDGLQYAVDNIVFNNFGAGFHLYGGGALSGYRIQGNAVFEYAKAYEVNSGRKNGTWFTVKDVEFTGNLGYGGTYAFGTSTRIYTDENGDPRAEPVLTDYQDIKLHGKTFIDARAGLQVLSWRNPSVQNNVFQVIPGYNKVITWKWNEVEQTTSPAPDPKFDSSGWKNNEWYWPSPEGNSFAWSDGIADHYPGSFYSWSSWTTPKAQGGMGFDSGSTLSTTALVDPDIHYRPNAYKKFSGSITIFNHPGASNPNVSIDLAKLGFTPGRRYVIRNAFDPCNDTGSNVQSGVYTGAEVSVSLDPANYTRAWPICYPNPSDPVNPYQGILNDAFEIQDLPMPKFAMFLVQQDEPGYCAAQEAKCDLAVCPTGVTCVSN